MRYVAMCVVVFMLGMALASWAWSDEVVPTDPGARRVLMPPPPAPPPLTYVALQPDELPPPEMPAPPAPPPAEVPVMEGAPPPPAELAPPPPVAAPMPAPCAPPGMVVYERQAIGPAMRAAPVCPPPAPVCCLARDAMGFSLAPDGCRYGCFTIWLEGAYTLLEGPEGLLGEPPFIAGPLATPNPIEWDSIDYEGAFGVRGTLQFQTGPQEYFEVRGTWYGTYEEEARDTGQFGFMPGPAGVGGVIAPNATTLTSESDIYGAEINYWSEIACLGYTSWSLGAGAHWVQFNETAIASNWATPFAPFTTPAFMQSEVENTFIGLQLGAMARYEFNPCFDIQAVLKGMIGNLNRDIVITDRSVFSGGSHTAESDEDEIVGGFDLDIILRFRFNRCFGITAGYNLLFVDNVLRGHDAMDFTMSTSGAIQPVHDVDQLVVHSFLVGLYVTF